MISRNSGRKKGEINLEDLTHDRHSHRKLKYEHAQQLRKCTYNRVILLNIFGSYETDLCVVTNSCRLTKINIIASQSYSDGLNATPAST